MEGKKGRKTIHWPSISAEPDTALGASYPPPPGAPRGERCPPPRPTVEDGSLVGVGLGLLPAEAEAAEVACFLADEIVAAGDVPQWQFAFLLAQRLQGLDSALATFDLDDEAFRDAVEDFWARLVDLGGVEDPPDPEDETEWANFLDDEHLVFVDAWTKVRVPGGGNALQAACRQAEFAPITVRRPGRVGTRYVVFLSLAFHLQNYTGDRDILLPIYPIAKWLGCTPQTVSAFTSLAVRHGLLIPVNRDWTHPAAAGRHASPKRKAKTWKFNLRSDAYSPPQ